jgi:C4-dicarboxylate-specific signal transduction histidine kinase
MVGSDGPVRVLIVEDNPADALMIRTFLAKNQRETLTCHTVDMLQTALAHITSEAPDVVLLDLSLPDSTGITACERIRLQCPTVPIVVLTGLDDENVALEALQRGAQDYLVKDQITSGALVRSLRYAIERQRVETALQQAHDLLEERVAERTEELSRTNEVLKQAIRDRERAEEFARARHEELAHLSRLNTLGEMASSLAHELNQPLTAIVAYTRSCLRRMSDDRWEDEEVRNEIELEMQKAADQAKRGAEIIQRLRRLVSKRDPERVAFRMNESIREVTELVAAELRANRVELYLELDESLPTVSADRVQIEQVLLNLLRNGIEAMANAGGKLRVRSARDVQNNIEVKVIDSGTGADAKTLGHVFDPFFSTKGAGLGLGLSISRSIIESHHGKFSVAPNLDRGLTFRFTLPIQAEPSDGEASRAGVVTEEA